MDIVTLTHLWNRVPHAAEIAEVAQLKIEGIRAIPPEPTSTAFFGLLRSTASSFLWLTGKRGVSDTAAIGKALEWLSATAVVGDLHAQFLASVPDKAEAIIAGLRDGCIGELRSSYHRYLTLQFCPDWDERCRLVGEAIAHRGEQHRAWQFVEVFEDMLEDDAQSDEIKRKAEELQRIFERRKRRQPLGL